MSATTAGPADAPACSQAGRTLIFERFGRFFEKRDSVLSVGRCSLCGADGVAIVDAKKGVGSCRAQASLTQKRHSPEKGHPIAYGVPLRAPEKPGMTAIAGPPALALIESDRTTVVCNVAPTEALPDWLEAHAPGTGVTLSTLMARVLSEVRAPYLLIAFDRKANIPIEITRDDERIMLNGTDPVQVLDRRRLAAIMDLARRFGPARLKAAAEVRERLAMGTNDPETHRRFAKLRETDPELVAVLRDVPGTDEPEGAMARALLGKQAKDERAAEAA